MLYVARVKSNTKQCSVKISSMLQIIANISDLEYTVEKEENPLSHLIFFTELNSGTGYLIS